MNTKLVAVIALPLVLTLSACGDTWGERAVTGGGIGAGTGLVIGAVAGLAAAGAGACRHGRGRGHRRRHEQQQIGSGPAQPVSSLILRSKMVSTSSSESPCASLRGPL